MKKLDLVIQNATGLHARPAKIFVNEAKTFQSDIRVLHGGKKANAKSLISMLALGVRRGQQIRVVVEGPDEDHALEALVSLVNSGLGEDHHGQPTPATAKAVVEAPAAPPTPDGMEDVPSIRGVPAAPGLAIGPIFHIQRAAVEVSDTFRGPAEEWERLQAARTQAQAQIEALRQQMLARSGADEAAIFEAHQEILDDPELLESVRSRIDSDHLNAANAWHLAVNARAQQVAGLEDSLLAARAADVRDVGDRVLRLLEGQGDGDAIAFPDHPVVVVADDLAPSDTASLDPERVLGFCTAAGGPTAHSAIIARALRLPAVVSAGPEVLQLEDGTPVILDGNRGTLIVQPDEAMVERARAQQEQQALRQARAAQESHRPAITQDGHRVEVVANIGGIEDARNAQAAGAEGVGLLRTEFLFLNRETPPSETEQFEVYRAIAEALEGQPVIVRTLDVGGDKPLPYIEVAPEANPFLGERGIRLCLARPELMKEQLRAILRAASSGTIRIMFPMVADLSEIRAARRLVTETARELNTDTVEIGIMVEVPSAALLADVFAAEVDFFSIGTNDLTQYTLAMDRMHASLAGKIDGLHPSVLRLIRQTVEGAHRSGKWVGVCGELAADPQAIPVLVGLGVDELSVNVPAIAATKAQIRAMNRSAVGRLAEEVLSCATAAEVRQRVANYDS